MSFYVWCYIEKEKGLRNKGAIFMLLCSPQLALIHKCASPRPMRQSIYENLRL